MIIRFSRSLCERAPTKSSEVIQKLRTSKSTFNGYIDMRDLHFQYFEESKTPISFIDRNASVKVSFKVSDCAWIPDDLKTKVLKLYSANIDKDGYFWTRSSSTRQRLINRAECLDYIRRALFSAQESDTKVIDKPTYRPGLPLPKSKVDRRTRFTPESPFNPPDTEG
ncbi:hypothetical protein ACOME3_004030 [Neoechinorhynchus agilis]